MTAGAKNRQLPTVLAIQHVACETVGTIAGALKRKRLSLKTVRVFEGDEVPATLEDAGGLIVMGGPMSVYEQRHYPFLRREMALIERALSADKPVLGICLGSQLLAATLGARVEPGGRKEIGWHRVRLTDQGRSDPLWRGVRRSFTAFHWHGDRFELPAGAIPLASSRMTDLQAFRYGRSYGLLFHIEVTATIIREMVRNFAGELRDEGLEGAAILAAAKRHLPLLQRIGARVFDHWADLARPATPAARIEVQRVYERPLASHGAVFLVDRLWPRGVTKQALRGARWLKEIAPSDALRRWYGHDPKKWREFKTRYFAELDQKQEAWAPVLDQARSGRVVLLHGTRDSEFSNAAALREYLIARLDRN